MFALVSEKDKKKFQGFTEIVSSLSGGLAEISYAVVSTTIVSGKLK